MGILKKSQKKVKKHDFWKKLFLVRKRAKNMEIKECEETPAAAVAMFLHSQPYLKTFAFRPSRDA